MLMQRVLNTVPAGPGVMRHSIPRSCHWTLCVAERPYEWCDWELIGNVSLSMFCDCQFHFIHVRKHIRECNHVRDKRNRSNLATIMIYTYPILWK